MSAAPFLVAPLDATHDRTGFHSGSVALDRYFREQVTRDVRRRVAACFVALDDRRWIAGYCTLASASLMLATRSEIAAYALMVDAKDDQAAAFYEHHGFIALSETPPTPFLLATAPASGMLESRGR